jgi:hypothetical protein
MPASTDLRAQIAARIPEFAFYRLVSWLHYAGEAELRNLRSFVPADKVAVDVGGWYGPWTYDGLAGATRSSSATLAVGDPLKIVSEPPIPGPAGQGTSRRR